jgi:hypothetical protein
MKDVVQAREVVVDLNRVLLTPQTLSSRIRSDAGYGESD